MSAAEAEGSFKVTDRRRRSGTVDEPLPPPAREASAAPATGATRPTGSPTASGFAERSLVGLFLTLGSTAAVALGAPDPVTGESHRDPAQAARVIDLLGLLRERTEGKRTSEETRILDELIYDLQLRYVEVMNRSG